MTGRHWGYSPLGRGSINGHARNRENRRHQHRENRSTHLAMIGALSPICAHCGSAQETAERLLLSWPKWAAEPEDQCHFSDSICHQRCILGLRESGRVPLLFTVPASPYRHCLTSWQQRQQQQFHALICLHYKQWLQCRVSLDISVRQIICHIGVRWCCIVVYLWLCCFVPGAGERPYKCLMCAKAFNQKGALQIHLMKHTGDRPYQCEFCPSAFSQRGNLRAHIQVYI